jgi:hypothetical protein
VSIPRNLNDANKGSTLTWSKFKIEANVIVSTLREAGPTLYDILPTGMNVPSFNHVVPPLTPFLNQDRLFLQHRSHHLNFIYLFNALMLHRL